MVKSVAGNAGVGSQDSSMSCKGKRMYSGHLQPPLLQQLQMLKAVLSLPLSLGSDH